MKNTQNSKTQTINTSLSIICMTGVAICAFVWITLALNPWGNCSTR